MQHIILPCFFKCNTMDLNRGDKNEYSSADKR